MKRILITHDDLDGIGCEVLFRKVYDNIQVFSCNYSNVDETVQKILNELPNGESVGLYITDISVNAETALMIDEFYKLHLTNIVVLIDHHKSAQWLQSKYPNWATVNTTICGTMGFIRYLLQSAEHSNRLRNYVQFADLVNDYDMWIHANPMSKKFNTLFYLIGREKFVERMLKNYTAFMTVGEHSLVDTEEARKQRYIESMARKALISGDMAVLFSDQYISELGHYILQQNDDVICVAIVDISSMKVSLRSKPSFDCSEFAKQYGGGGHKLASGFQINDKQVLEILGIVF